VVTTLLMGHLVVATTKSDGSTDKMGTIFFVSLICREMRVYKEGFFFLGGGGGGSP
jgi:hypothetical protein